MSRLLLLAVLLVPAHAHALPLIPVLASVVAAAVPAFATAAFVISVATSVFGSVNARRQAKKAAAQQRAEFNASLQDRTVTVLRGDPPWQVIYGRCIVGGAVVDMFTSDKLNGRRQDGTTYTKADALRHMVIVLAAHECQAIHEVYIDGVPIGAVDANGWATGGAFFQGRNDTRTVTFTTSVTLPETPLAVLQAYSQVGSGIDVENTSQTVTISGNTLNGPAGVTVVCDYTVADGLAGARYGKNLGSATQAVDPYLNAINPTRYTTNHRLRGLCYISVTLDLEYAPWQGGPPNITADVSGRIVFDTRTGLAATGTDISNNALCVRDFLISPWGYSASAADIDEPFCNAAASACDANISLTVGGVTTTGQDTYQCNGAFTTDQSPEAVLEDLAESMAGTVTYGAKWQISAGVWTAPVMTLTDTDLNGMIEVLQADTNTDELFNGVRGQVVLRGAQTPSDFNPYANSTFVTADGRELWTNVSLPFTDNLARARNLCRIFVERNRQGQVIRYPAKLRAWVLQVGDRVSVTSAEYGFTAKTYRVTDWQFDITGAVVLTLQEDVASIYDLADAAVADPAPNTDLPNPYSVATLSSVTVASGTNELLRAGDGTIITRVRVSWAAVTDVLVVDGGHIEVRWRRQGSSTWQRLPQVPGLDTSAWISPARDRDRIVVQARAVNRYGARGAPVNVAHTVVGKTQAPRQVKGLVITPSGTNVRISWQPSTEADYGRTELRQGGTSWSDATSIWVGKASFFIWEPPASGSYTIRARHYDLSGNVSATDAVLTVGATAPAGAGAPVSFGVSVYAYLDTAGSAVSRIRFNVDGTIEGRKNAGAWYSLGAWYTPTGGTPGNSYRIKATLSSGDTPSGTLGTLTALSSAQEWSLSQSVDGSKLSSLSFDFATNGSPTVLATGTGVLESVMQIGVPE